MTSLSTLLSSLQKSSTKSSGWGTGGASGWGGSSSTWGGKSSSYVKIPKFGKIGKISESQTVANKIMSGSKAKASHANESVLGSILGGVADVTGNLAKDAISTAENVPSGLYKVATTNPMDTIHAVGKDYSTRYGKLFSGDFSGFAHQLGQHPLSYLLDAATVATAGAGSLAKVGILSNDLKTVGLSADRALVKAGEKAPTSQDFFGGVGFKKVDVNLSRNPATRALQRGVYGVQARLPANLPVLGEQAAAKRSLANQFQMKTHGMDSAAMSPVRDQYRKMYGPAADAAITNFHHVVGTGGALGKSTQVWKDFTLAGRPGFQLTNLVGNTGMFHGANGIFGATKGMSLAAKGELDKTWNRWFGSAGDTYGGTEASKGNSFIRRMINKSYGLQGKGEMLNRKGTMYATAMKNSDIKTLVRQGEGKGLTTAQALEDALAKTFAGPNGEAIQREIIQKVNDTMGDYSHYSAAEQRLKQVVPFYGWNRHASRYLYATARDRPHQLLALNQLSKMGAQLHQGQGFAGTPDFMTGYIKTLGHTFDTAPLNPLKGGTDVLKSVKDMIAGDASASAGDLGSNLNPFIANTVQGLTGKSLLTGALIAKNKYGLLGSVLQQTVTGLPQYRVADKLISSQFGSGPDTSNPHTFLTATGRLKQKFVDASGHVKLDSKGFPTELPNRHMLNSTPTSVIATFLGIPDRGAVNQKVAKTVAAKIATQNNTGFHAPKPRKKTKTGFKAVTQGKGTTKAGGWGSTSSAWGG